MAAPTLAQIREGLRANLDAIPGTKAHGYKVPNLTTPCVFVKGPTGTDYHQSMVNGIDRWTLVVIALVGTSDSLGAQKLLDKFIGSTDIRSVKAAIEKRDGPNGEVTLGGVVSSALVTRCDSYGEYEIKGTIVLGATFYVDIYAPGI